MSTAIVWFRRDLRLADHPALTAAAANHQYVVPVYIDAPEEEAPWAPGGASRWWLHHSLAALQGSLAALGAPLVIRQGESLATLRALVKETGASAVYWSRLYEPKTIGRDANIKAALRDDGLTAESSNAALLFEPWQTQTGSGDPYRVFTPFWKNCAARLDLQPAPLPVPAKLRGPKKSPMSLDLAALKLLPKIPWAGGLAEHWTPGEAGAMDRLEAFLDGPVPSYNEDRNRPDLDATSRLSPHLHFGEISPRQALAATRAAVLRGGRVGIAGGAEHFLREIGWREFNHHLLYHYPHTTDAPLDRRFAELVWRTDAKLLAAWQLGRTGYPIVDAGMRELWHTGYMHNRVRMVAASLLVKNLGQSWLEGARWFWDTLVDADLPNNTAGWQWTAGCGADAAPYYRIFNPVLQTERFDPHRRYLRRWLPEIAALPDAWIHKPWEAPPEVWRAAGLTPGKEYPIPAVDLRASRDTALQAYETVKVAVR